MTVDSGIEAEQPGAEPNGPGDPSSSQTSLATAAARNLATTTKTAPQMQGITSRWLLRTLPWVEVSGGTYRVNRRLSYAVGRGRVSFAKTGAEVRVVPPSLAELPQLRGFRDTAVLNALAERFEQRDFEPGEELVTSGEAAESLVLIAHGKAQRLGDGKYGHTTVLGVLADGEHYGDEALGGQEARWTETLRTVTAGTALILPRQSFRELVGLSAALREQLAAYAAGPAKSANKHGEADIELASGHSGELELPGTFVDYELAPREYELAVAQTVLRVHSRVADLYNQPMNQTEQQLRLTIEALRERQEHELVNNPEFGLLANADYEQRVHTHGGPPTPDDLDELLSRRRKSKFFLAHPKAIAAFGRECSKRGLYPDTVDVHGNAVPAWRGVPIFPCNKIPVSEHGTTSIMVMRTGESDQGVVGLHQTGLPDEYEPGLSVRFMGIDEKAVISYLVSTYYSAAVLVPDALGVLENVEIARDRS
ncbi:family 2B encapsulin nanocompartment shell protein [Phaeacidiphilus oryzae]|uniref:family 2B encapsulin nanocompartment shell protein n=1 Tax=Phaeacidiphilus oryzae TaxID=348818 RepID=UPI000561D244|nr:family 2B encapsulin nanocompartment shell protein [Phaeacidiphilus oryzae]